MQVSFLPVNHYTLHYITLDFCFHCWGPTYIHIVIVWYTQLQDPFILVLLSWFLARVPLQIFFYERGAFHFHFEIFSITAQVSATSFQFSLSAFIFGRLLLLLLPSLLQYRVYENVCQSFTFCLSFTVWYTVYTLCVCTCKCVIKTSTNV